MWIKYCTSGVPLAGYNVDGVPETYVASVLFEFMPAIDVFAIEMLFPLFKDKRLLR